jgi:hypothetical protein
VKVPTSVLCPVCKANKQPNRLNQNLGSDELFCMNPKNGKKLHSFPGITEVEAYDPSLAYLETQGEAAEPETPLTTKEEPAPVLEAPIAKSEPAKVVEMDPMPAETVEIPSLFNAEVPPKPPAKVIKFVPPPARKAPGGVLMITVRIPDQHVSFLEAEAKTQNETVEAFFQRVLEYGLDSRWFY